MNGEIMTVSEKSIEQSFITFLKGENLELYDLNIANYPSISKIEIYIYSPESLDHSIIERLTYHFHGVLHDLNIEKGTYELIVSSPGLERKLRTRRHFELAIGEYITLKTINDIGGKYVVSGELIELTDKSLIIETSSESYVKIEMGNIKNAKVKLHTNKKELIG